MPQGQVIVHVERKAGAQPCCPTCSKPAPGYDSRRRRWRHLDTCQYKTILEADVPRVKCPEHGVVTTTVPWAEPNSGFTALFEALVIDWLKEASTSAVARLMGLSWNAIDGIMQRAVKRGLARRKKTCAQHLGVQASLRSRERFWDIRVPKIDSIFDNSLVPRPSWSPGVPPQHRKLVAATHRSPI